MAISIGATLSNSGNQTNSSGFSFNHTTNSNTKCLVVVITGYDSSATDSAISSVTWNGVAMAEIPPGRFRNASDFQSIWYLSLPAIGGAYSITVTPGGTCTDIQATAINLVDSSAYSIVYDSYDTTAGTGSASGVVNPAASGSYAVGGGVAVGGTPTSLSITAGTEASGSEVDMGSQTASVGYAAASGGTATITWSYSSVACTCLVATFKPQTAPSVTTNTATNVDEDQSTLNGNVTNDGGDTVTARGFVYSDTDTTPTIGEGGVTNTGNLGGTTGSYSTGISGLSPNTTYYYQAYATNGAGTAYGGVQSFTTDALPTVTLSSPSDTAEISDTTPDLTFTGTDPTSGNDVSYEVQVDTVDTFDSQSGFGTTIISNDFTDDNTIISMQGGTGTSGESSQASAQAISLSENDVVGAIKVRYAIGFGTPTDNAVIELTSSTTGSALATATISSTNFTGTVTQFTLFFDSPYTIPSTGTYYLRFTRSGARDVSNYFIIRGSKTNVYAGGNYWSRDNNSWTEKTPSSTYGDLQFVLAEVGGSPLIDSNSITDSGFSGTPDNTDPFASGQAVTYTVQSALSDDTYYWRVRAKDPSGANAYGAWATTRSFTVTTGTLATNLLDGKLIIKSSTTNLLDGKVNVKSSTTKLLDGLLSITNSATNLLDGLVKIKSSATNLLDGLAKIKSSATNYLDGKVLVKNAETLFLDGKIFIKSAATSILDGKVRIKDVATALLDGKVTIKDTTTLNYDGLVSIKNVATTLYDGKVTIKDATADLLDGKVIIIDSGTGLLDGKVRIKDAIETFLDGKVSIQLTGSVTDLYDGKVRIKDVASQFLDGTVTIKDAEANFLDGKVTIKIAEIAYLDGKLIVKDADTNLLDGRIQIKDVSTALLDGKLIIQSSATDLLDGIVKIKDSEVALLDGKVKVKDSATELLDGKLVIKDYSIDLLDGKIVVKDADVNLLDGKVIINVDNGYTTDVLDGKLYIYNSDYIFCVNRGKILKRIEADKYIEL